LKTGLIAAGQQLVTRATHALEHHPKHVTAIIAGLLLGGGGGAFAVASLGPDPSLLPVREVTEWVDPLPLQEQASMLEGLQLMLFRSDVSRASDTVDGLLSRLGIDDALAAAYLRNDSLFRTQLLGRAGRNLTVEASESHTLQKLSARWSPEDDGTFKRLVIERLPSGQFSSRIETSQLVPATRMGSATIRTSLFAAADEARIPDRVVSQIIDIFSGQIDFRRALRSGDRLSVVYEALEADGEPLRTGRILSVEFVNRGVPHQAMWFQQPGNKGAYYGLDGTNLSNPYLATPLEFSRVTSNFAMRFHPILHRWKAHLGTDFGAAVGTPVRVVGDGVVEFAGEQNGFGNVVIVRHSNTDETLYAHLSRIDVRPRQTVGQGQHIGAVGTSGWATGPHLHFEFRVNGVHRDPVAMARQGEAAPLTAAIKPQFDRLANTMREQLAVAASSTLASAD
jgi:murein DD-endopeptidase MepM/ murein hydrolase activator NlpD